MTQISYFQPFLVAKSKLLRQHSVDENTKKAAQEPDDKKEKVLSPNVWHAPDPTQFVAPKRVENGEFVIQQTLSTPKLSRAIHTPFFKKIAGKPAQTL